MSKEPTFSKDGFRRACCSECGQFLTAMYLGEKKDKTKMCRNKKCSYCKKPIFIRKPEECLDKDGKKGVNYYRSDIMKDTFTAVDEREI